MIKSKLVEAGKNVSEEERLSNIKSIYGDNGGAKVLVEKAVKAVEGNNHGYIDLFNQIDSYLEVIGYKIELKKK